MIWLSLVFNYLGLLAFAAALESHRRTFPRVANQVRPSRLLALGGVSQTVALTLAVSNLKIAAGLVLWAIGWPVCGLILSLLLAFRAKLWPLPAFILLLVAATDRLGLV